MSCISLLETPGPKTDMSDRIVIKRRTVNALLIAVLLLSLPGTGLLALALSLSGLAAAGGGLRTASSGDATVFLMSSALAFAASAATLCWRGVASLISRSDLQFKASWPNAEPRPTRVDAPAYGWTCHVCEGSNLAGQTACMACGAAPSLSMAEVATAKERLGRSLPPFQDTSHGRT